MRIVRLTEEAVETLCLLGQEDRIVGVSGYAVSPSLPPPPGPPGEAPDLGRHRGLYPEPTVFGTGWVSDLTA